VQIKLAGKAREKFKQIEAQGQAGIPQPGTGATQQKTPSKWDKKAEGPAEVVNRFIGRIWGFNNEKILDASSTTIPRRKRSSM